MKQIYYTFIRVENAAVIIGIILTMLITFGNVITRYIFRIGVGWSEELVRYLMIWITFIGMDIAIRTNEHVAIDFFVNLLREGRRQFAEIVGHLISFLFYLFLFVSSLVLTVHVFQDEQISAGLQIPMGYIYLLLPLITFISTVRYLVHLVITAMGKDRSPSTGGETC